MEKDIEKRINDLMLKSTIDKEAAKKHGLDNHYVIFHKGWQHKSPAWLVGKGGSHFGWSKHIEKELKRLTDDWLLGDAAGIKLPELVRRYQSGEESFLDAIKKQLESKINYVINQELGEAKAVFTRLDGKSAKSPKRGQTVIPRPGDDDYNENEIQQIDLILQERFTESELRALVDKSLSDALRTYKAGKKTFKSWFGDTFTHDVRNYKNDCKGYWQQKPKKANWAAYEQKHKEAGQVWDYSTLYENYPGEYIDRLNDDQKRLLNVRATAGAEVLFKTDEEIALGVKEGKRKKIQGELEREYIDWLKGKNIKVKAVIDTGPRIKSNVKLNTAKKVDRWFNKTL